MLALAVALVVAVPSALRVRAAGGNALDGLVVTAAIWLCFILPIALLRRRAARGWRGIVGADPLPDLPLGLGLWAGLSTALLAVLAAVLKSVTHHRGLGGATVGVFGAAAVGAAAIVAFRLLAWGRRLRDRGLSERALSIAALALALGPSLVVALLVVGERASWGVHGASALWAVIDLLLAVAALSIAVAWGLRRLEAWPRFARLAALPLLVVLLAVGFGRVELSSNAARSVRAGGGVAAAVLWVLEQWTDVDGDGAGAHFGGRDCDEGDAERHPGAADTEGDGRDLDCDGADGRALAGQQAAASLAAAPASTAKSAAPGAAAPSASARPEPTTTAASQGAAPARPDIVLVTLDTVRASRTSAYGYAKDTTPNLVTLARRGLLFAYAYAIGSTTQRALTPLVSGVPYSDTRRSADDWPTILDENETVAERLKRAGYATAAVTSFTWLRQDRGFHQGFDVFDESAFRAEHPERGTTGAEAVKAARQVYGQLVGGQAPLFFWVHLFDAHAKYLEHPGIDFGSGTSGRYDGEIAYVDQRLAELVKLVSDSKRARRTLWIVHGSHGEAFREHGKEGHGDEVYDEMIRVPLVMMAPWSKPGRYETDAVSTLDIVPTLLDYAGASRDGVAGVSLRPVVEGELSFERAPVFAYAWHRTCVIDWPLKLLVKSREERPDRLLLFDLRADPDEQRDISDERREELQRLDELRKRQQDER
jgi:arylsulfatase A-like enzyme